MGASADWAQWAARWDAMQQLNIPRREERFQVMLELAAEVLGGEPKRLLDLACGTGSIAARALRRFPTTQVVAIDVDPLLLTIGERTLGDAGGRLQWVRHDLRDPGWAEALRAFGPFDAVLSSTALHWLAAGELVLVYRRLATLMPPGGIFLNAEHIHVAPAGSRFGPAVSSLRMRLNRERQPEGESWAEWWDRARSEAAFAELIAARDRVFHDHPHHDEHVTAAFHESALGMAGFAETAVPWRFLDDTIVAGIR